MHPIVIIIFFSDYPGIYIPLVDSLMTSHGGWLQVSRRTKASSIGGLSQAACPWCIEAPCILAAPWKALPNHPLLWWQPPNRQAMEAFRGRHQHDSSPRDPKQGERGKIDKFNKIRTILDFSPKWSWGPPDRLKILSWSQLRFSTIGKLILRTFTFS